VISTLVIVGLALVWAVVLLPDLVARISRGRRSDTIRSFNTQLSSLGRSAPVRADDNVIDIRARKPATNRATRNTVLVAPYAGSLRPAHGSGPVTPRSDAGITRSSGAVRKRRQDVLIALGAAALLTLLATVAFGGVFLYLHLVADLLMAAYLIALQRVVTVQAAHGASAPGHAYPGHVAAPTLAPRSLEPQQIAN
jgi:hypothetical protein